MKLDTITLETTSPGIYRIKPAGRESRTRQVFSTDEAIALLKGFKVDGWDTTEAENALAASIAARLEVSHGL